MSDTAGRRVYLAGPEVFLHDAAELGRRKVELCAAHGLIGLFPGDAVDELVTLTELAPTAQGRAIFEVVRAQIDASDAVIANVTPFRGPSADAGTVWEIGYAVGRGLPVFAYTSVLSHYAERVTDAPVDRLLVESFDLADNLMLEGALAGGGSIVRVDGGEHPIEALRHLAGFEICARAAAAHFTT